jgi:hypothetical protein
MNLSKMTKAQLITEIKKLQYENSQLQKEDNCVEALQATLAEMASINKELQDVSSNYNQLDTQYQELVLNYNKLQQHAAGAYVYVGNAIATNYEALEHNDYIRTELLEVKKPWFFKQSPHILNALKASVELKSNLAHIDVYLEEAIDYLTSKFPAVQLEPEAEELQDLSQLKYPHDIILTHQDTPEFDSLLTEQDFRTYAKSQTFYGSHFSFYHADIQEGDICRKYVRFTDQIEYIEITKFDPQDDFQVEYKIVDIKVDTPFMDLTKEVLPEMYFQTETLLDIVGSSVIVGERIRTNTLNDSGEVVAPIYTVTKVNVDTVTLSVHEILGVHDIYMGEHTDIRTTVPTNESNDQGNPQSE